MIRDGFITTQLSGRWKVLWGVLKPGMIQLFSYQWVRSRGDEGAMGRDN